MTIEDSNLKRILGVDLGMRRTGIAVSDELHLTTRALPNLIPKSRIEDVRYLLKLCQELDIAQVVIGYPVLMRSEEEGTMARRASGFAKCLQEEANQSNVKISVYLMNESLTSKEASRRLVQSGIKKENRKKALDGEVARILIEDFIELKKEQ